MLHSGKQVAVSVSRKFPLIQHRGLPAFTAALPPIIRAQLRKSAASCSNMNMLRGYAKPFSILVRATTTTGSATPVCGVQGAGANAAVFTGDMRLGKSIRAFSTGPFSGPFSGPGSKPQTGVPPVGPTGDEKREDEKSAKGAKRGIPAKERPTLSNRFMEPPEDGLTRYPTLRSPQGVLRGLDYMGTAVFALSGTVTAGTVGMDLLGCMIVGTITATGGGTVRDLLLGNNPVFWMHETEYLWMCLITSMVVFFVWSYLAERGFRDDMEVLNWADAMGIGAFCCIGAQAGVRKGLSKIVCICCGMLTSSFGGVIRDVLCSRPPRILFSHAEIYASTALLGSTVYIASKAAGFSPVARITAGFVAAAGLRVLAFKTDIRLPSWTQPSDELVHQLQAEHEQEKNEKLP